MASERDHNSYDFSFRSTGAVEVDVGSNFGLSMNVLIAASSNKSPLTLVSGLTIFGVLAVVMGLATLWINSQQRARATDWQGEVDNSLDTSYKTNLKRQYVASSKTKFLFYSAVFWFALGVILLIAGGVAALTR
jgi:cell division protein FtsW (lipid II flippase)